MSDRDRCFVFGAVVPASVRLRGFRSPPGAGRLNCARVPPGSLGSARATLHFAPGTRDEMNDQPATDSAPVVVALPAVISAANAALVHGRLSAALASGAPVIIADLSATAVCGTAGVHRLLMISRQAAVRGAWLRLVIPPGAVTRRVLVLMGADHLLPVYSTIAEARTPPAGPQDPLAGYLRPATELPPATP